MGSHVLMLEGEFKVSTFASEDFEFCMEADMLVRSGPRLGSLINCVSFCLLSGWRARSCHGVQVRLSGGQF